MDALIRWEQESHFSREIRHFFDHCFSPFPYCCVSLNQGSIFLFANILDRINAVFPAGYSWFTVLLQGKTIFAAESIICLPVVLQVTQRIVHLSYLALIYKTLPKAQRTRGLSSSCQSNILKSYHKFKRKSWWHFIFRISTKHQVKISTKHQHLH